MKVTHTKVTAFTITDIAGLDPILVIAREYEDPEFHRATLVVQCFDRAWTCYWGSMGDTLENFIKSVNTGYIAGCLIRGTRTLCFQDGFDHQDQFDNDYRWLLDIADAIKEAVKNGALAGVKEAA